MRRVLTSLFLVPLLVFSQDPQSLAIAAVGANAGRNQTAQLGDLVILNGSASTNPSGIGTLSYKWKFAARPEGSAAVLSNGSTVAPAFVVDAPGSYVVDLIVGNGLSTSSASVTVTTVNTPPVADAGAAQVVPVPATVQLNGAGSTDVDGDLLSYQWSLLNVPAGSQATLSSATAVHPTFHADALGTYVAQLIVNDGHKASAPATVTISTGANQAPTAHAGPNQAVRPGTLALLNGTGTDPQNLSLTYRWALISAPAGSQAMLSSGAIANPSFLVDLDGTYVAQLIVNNGAASSAPSTVTITTNRNTAPVANAGPNQNVTVGGIVSLNGAASSDADNNVLNYAWSLLSLPEGSAAKIAGSHSATPEFTADVTGTYVAQLIVNDGMASSRPATVTISTESAAFAPVEHANVSSKAGKAPSLTLSLNDPISALIPSKVAIFRPSLFMAVAQDVNGNIAWDQNVDQASFFGTTGDVMIYGDWDGTGSTKVGIFRASAGLFALDMNGNGAYDPGVDTYGYFGQNGDVPIVGDWNGDGRTKIGIYRPASTLFALDYNGNLAFNAGIDKAHGYGLVGDTPIIGDWTGDGKAKIGIFRNGFWSLDADNNQTLGAGDVTGTLGQAGDTPLLGDWNGDGKTKVGYYRSNAALFAEDYNGNMTWDAGVDRSGVFGSAGSTPVVGDWDGTGVTRIGVFFGAGYWGLDYNGNLSWDAGVQFGGFGDGSLDTPVIGRWAAPVGPPSSVTATSGTPQTAPLSTAFASPFVATVKDAGNHPVPNVVVTFNAPANGASGTFAGGVNTATTNAGGVATSVVFTANAIAGAYTVTATSGSATLANFALTNVAAPNITLTTASVGENLQAPVNLTLSQPAPTGNFPPGLVVTLTSADPNKLLLAGRPVDAGTGTLIVTVPEGQTSIGVYVHGVANSGTVMVTASASGYNNGTSSYTLTPSALTLSGPAGAGAPFSVNQGTSTTLTVNSVRLDSNFNIVQGQQVRGGFSASVPVTSFSSFIGTITTSPVVLNGGDSSATTQFNAANPGQTTLSASAPSGFSALGQGSSMVATVNPVTLTPGNVTVGRNLMTTTQVAIAGPIPPAGLTMTLTSDNPSLFVLSTSAGVAGSASITVHVPEFATSSPFFYVQGVAASSAATYTASMPGFPTSTGMVTLAPSGFVISGPTGLGQASFSTTSASANSTVTIYSALLNSSMNYVSQMPVAAGVAVTVESSATTVGTITSSPVNFAAGSSFVTTEFDPVGPGSSSLTVTQPNGFNIPAQYTSVAANVITPGIAITNGIAVGFNLEAAGTVTLGAPAPAPNGLDVSLVSNSASLLLSNDGLTTGSGSIIVHIAAGGTNGTYYIQSTAGSGSGTYTASAPSFGTRNATISFTPSGAVIAGLFGLNTPFFTASVTGGNAPIKVYMAQLDPTTRQFVGVQALAGGQSVSVTLNSSQPGIGTVASPVIINGGPSTSNGLLTQFSPLAQGNTVVSVTPLGTSCSPAVCYMAATDNASLTALVGP